MDGSADVGIYKARYLETVYLPGFKMLDTTLIDKSRMLSFMDSHLLVLLLEDSLHL